MNTKLDKRTLFIILLVIAGIVWIISGISLATRILPYRIPYFVSIGSFVTSTSTLALVLITWSYASGQRDMVEESRKARVQAVSPTFGLKVVQHASDIGKYTLNVANFGSGTAHDVKAVLSFYPNGTATIEKAAPIVNNGEGFKVGQLNEIEDSISQEKMESDFQGVRLKVEYMDQLDNHQSTIRNYDFNTLREDISAVKPISELNR